TLSVHGQGGASAAYAFSLDQTPQADLKVGGTYQGTLAGSGEAQIVHTRVPSAQVLSINLTDASAADLDEIYARLGARPTRADYDYRFAAPGNNQSILIPSAAAGDWYVLVYAQSVRNPSGYSLSASGAATKISSVTPGHAGNSAPVTLTLTGAGFVNGTIV